MATLTMTTHKRNPFLLHKRITYSYQQTKYIKFLLIKKL